MKAEAGWGAAALVAVAALVGVTSQSGGKGAPDAGLRPGGVQSTQSSAAKLKSGFESGPCTDLEGRLQTFLLISKEEIAAPESCYDAPTPLEQKKSAAADEQSGTALRSGAASLRYMIAIVPDPLHTHFSLGFDRLTEAIQQGAQDEGYLYDSSWMPWETEKPSLVLLEDRDKLDDRTKAREDQPGILLFRRQPKPDNAKPDNSRPPLYSGKPYWDGMAVFVVGEEPTGGVHKRQFENAAAWINALQLKINESQPRASGNIKPPTQPVEILGPTFSGSLPSLAQMLLDDDFSPAIPKPGSEAAKGTSLDIDSGGVTSESGVGWFEQQLPGVRFHSFQESDTQLLVNYRHYLVQQGFKLSHLAIVSEDETAFGGFGDDPPECEPESTEGSDPEKGVAPACVFYPRDISALRAAYQKQSIFTGSSGDKSAETGQKTLPTDLADPDDEDHDTVRNYSGDQTALSQEAVLQQIVSVLRAHQSEYVVLRSSNPLDQLFLSHYLRLAYPQGRVVLEGSDLLLRRESGAATLSGIMTLTTYPLLPWESHWASFSKNPRQAFRHSHRVFAQDGAEATYVAIRFLLRSAETQKNPPGRDDSFLPANDVNLELADYGPPFWLQPDCLKNPNGAGPESVCRRPSTWLSVLGRDGFWPVAALPRADGEGGKGLYARPSFKKRLLGALFAWRRLFNIRNTEAPHGNWPEWPPIPLSMKILLVLLVFWAGFHLHCCAMPSLTVKPGHRAYFVRVPRGHHLGLIVLGSVLVTLVPVFLEWGYGAMSQNGEPVHLADAYRGLLFAVWLMSGAAVVTNAWNESTLERVRRPAATEWERVKAWLWRRRRIWAVAGWYVAATCFSYCVVDFSFEESMGASNAVPTYWRAINLSNGVSPLAPLIALAGGLYLWFWYSLQGLALFNNDRPVLPTRMQLGILDAQGEKAQTLRMFSREEAGRPLEAKSLPFGEEFTRAAVAIFFGVLLIGKVVTDVPFRSLGSTDFSRFFAIAMAVCVALMLGNAWQLFRVWLRLRQLLVLLDRLHLRRTMGVLKGYSWGSVWGMGGRVLDVRYRLLAREMEALTHLSNSLLESVTVGDAISVMALRSTIQKTHGTRAKFAKWYSDNWDNWKERDLGPFYRVQRSIAGAAGVVMAQLLVPHWRSEDRSLLQKLPKKENDSAQDGDARESGDQDKNADGSSSSIRNAEELVCLVYLGFIQNILGRMRTLVMQIMCMFVAAAIAVASYPFDPRSEVSAAMIVLFVILGTIVVIVYSQMYRDPMLSLVTNTTPGELGTEFWFKLLAFGAGPILGLLATIFPELPGSLFSWLQPGLTSIK